MGEAFRRGVEAGRLAFDAGLPRAGTEKIEANATSPLTAFLAEANA
jgi:thiazole synthase